MHRVGSGLICLILVIVLGNVALIGAEETTEMCVPMGSITLAPPDSVDSLRAEVEFPHALHFTNDCKTCHHQWGGKGVISGCMTAGCHDVTEAPAKGKDPRYYKTAYHGQCLGCHKQIRSNNAELERSGKTIEGKLPAAGPTGCVGCHS